MKHMSLLLSLVAWSVVAMAAPLLSTDPVDPLATHCGWSIDGSTRQDQSVTNWQGTKYCTMDIAGMASRSHAFNVNVSYTDPVWGKRSSLPSADYVTTPAPVPTQPTGLGVQDTPAPIPATPGGLKILP